MIWSDAVSLGFFLISAIFIIYGWFSVLNVFVRYTFCFVKLLMFCAYAVLFK
jgi:hypothetical protein